MKNFSLFGDSWSDNASKKTEEPKKKVPSRLSTKSKKSDSAYRTISEVAEDMNIATHVLRFWETKFPEVQPMRRSGGRRYYRPDDIKILKRIQYLLHDEGYTIKGVQALIKKEGIKSLVSESLPNKEKKAKGSAANTLDKKGLLNELKSIRKILEH